jgi:hypothetical protein
MQSQLISDLKTSRQLHSSAEPVAAGGSQLGFPVMRSAHFAIQISFEKMIFDCRQLGFEDNRELAMAEKAKPQCNHGHCTA